MTMIRRLIRGLVIVIVATLFVEAASGQPERVPDKVVVRDKQAGTTKAYDGTLKFGTVGFQVVSPEKKVLVSFAPSDLVKYTPGDLVGLDRGQILAQITTEDKKTKKEYITAREGYVDMLKKAPTAPEPSKRYLEFKIAQMTTNIANESADDENWSTLADAAVKAWASYLGEYKTSWEVWPATRAYTRLLEELNKYDEIARTWARTAKTADLPSDLKLEAEMQEIDAQIRSKAFASAADKADTMGKASAPGANKDKLDIYHTAAKAAANGDYGGGIKGVQERIDKTKDVGVRGVGYSMIGELYLLDNKPRDAMWAFLWVETVYNSDRDEAFKAMCRLAEVFKAQNDDDRLKAYREKIRRARSNF
jgi:hypothetical protein